MVCKRCGGSKLQRSRRRTEWESIAIIFGLVPVRCTECLDRRLRLTFFAPAVKPTIGDAAKQAGSAR